MNDKIEKVKSIHIVKFVGHSISTDGKVAMIMFMIADEGGERQFAITIPVELTKGLVGVAHEAMLAAERAGNRSGSAVFHHPVQFDVGSSTDFPGRVIILLNKETPDEFIFTFANLAGIEFAEAIKKDIMPRLTLEERRQMSLIKPSSKIIIPS
jgi:hypothetical protein